MAFAFADKAQAKPSGGGLGRAPSRPVNQTSLASHRAGVLQRKSAGHRDREPHEIPPIVHEVLRSPGQPLDAETRAFMEPRFGHDFSKVRVHVDAKAAESAMALHANAYTIGREIVFGAQQYETKGGRRSTLIAHELAHVLQQSESPNNSTMSNIEIGNEHLEQEADATANSVLNGQSPEKLHQLSRPAIQLQAAAPILLDPMIISSNPKEGAAEQKVSDEVMERLWGIGIRFLDEWFSAMSAGVDSLPEPEDPEAETYWFIALAGNLAWAVTSLMAAELVVPISVLGAAVGSGSIQKLLGESAPPAKPFLIASLAKARDAMEKTLKPKIIDADLEILDEKITDKSRQEQVLWSKMFLVPYEKKFESMVAIAVKHAMAAFSDFMSQYKVWKDEIWALVVKDRQISMPKGPLGEPGESAARAGYLLRPTTGGERAAAEKQHPFNPRLKF
jgi:Domain of unknown function (DUF4157)